jgi:hypothetical protein
MMRTTSSSISSSDRAADLRLTWRRFCVVLVATAAGLLAAILAAAYALDPYDTGRSGLFAKPGVRPQGPRTAAASRGRDPRFAGAVFGNSHIQLVSPERLAEATGIPFVQLSIPATGPKEQLTLIDWFLRHHDGGARALVLSLDGLWCTPDPELRNEKPFPFWLFSRSPLEYARGLLRYDVLEELPRRLRYVFDRNARRAAPDGYWDYEPNYIRLGYLDNPEARARLERAAGGGLPANPELRFPAADNLEALLARLPPDLSVVLVFPPAYVAHLARPGSPAAEVDRACKAAFTRAARAHPGAGVIDWRVARAETRDPALFFDQTHYRHPLARALERDIADVIGRTTAEGRAP